MNDTDLNQNNPQLETRLSDLLHRRGEHLGVRGSGTTAVRRRARARRDRGRAVMAGGTAVVVFGSAAAVWWSRGPSDDTVRVVQGAELDAGGAPQLEWSLVDSLDIGDGFGLSRTGAVRDSQGVRYVLSTQPGTAPTNSTGAPDVRSTLYASSDGTNWTPRQGDGEYTLRGLAIRGDELYTVGTSASTRAKVGTHNRPGDAVIRRSSDGGVSWTDTTLPIDFESIADAGGSVFASAAVAVSDDRVVALVQWTTFPGEAQVRAVVGGDAASNGYNVTATGVDVYAPVDESKAESKRQPDIARSLTWAELGIDPAEAMGTRMFVSDDGKSFTTVDAPFGPASTPGMDPSIVASGDGFLAAIATAPTPMSEYTTTLYRSTDGRAWAPVPTTGLAVGTGSLSRLGADLVIAGYGQNGSFLARSTDGGTAWETVDLVGIGRSLGLDTPALRASSFAISDAGFVAVLDEPLDQPQLQRDPTLETETTLAPEAEEALKAEALKAESVRHPTSIIWSTDGVHWGMVSADQVTELTGGFDLDSAPRIVSNRIYLGLLGGSTAPGQRRYLTAMLPG